MSMHRAAQSFHPLGHPHAPLLQTCPLLSLQAVVHEPQWRTSVVTSTQAPSQFCVPEAVQESTHWPALQTCSEEHWNPQAPQLDDSVWRSAQTEPQSV
jgi:hypothetical protein